VVAPEPVEQQERGSGSHLHEGTTVPVHGDVLDLRAVVTVHSASTSFGLVRDLGQDRVRI
jgi:hypothetical protein